MKETTNKNTGAKAFLLRTFADPVLWYTVLVMTSLMYHYRDRVLEDNVAYFHDLGWSVLTLVLGWVIFRIFDFIQKHHLLGFVAYTALLFLFGYAVRYSIDYGRVADNYPIAWSLWFLSPQDSLDYSRWYAMALFLLFLLFMTSVIYYFTRVRYRIFMNFLIFIIPFAIYGKEYEKMPTGFIILLAVGYILMMVYYRQLENTETTEFIDRNRAWKTVSVYAVIFATAAAVIPKPEITADRTVLETLISAEQFTDRLNAMLNVFRDTTSAEQFRQNTDTTVLYEARASEDLRLKTATFSTYDFKTDLWSVEELDTRFVGRYDELPLSISGSAGYAPLLLKCAELDGEFAEKYDLTEFAGQELVIPETRELAIFSTYRRSQYAPVPQFAQHLRESSRRGEIALLRSGLVYSPENQFSETEWFRFDYSADTFFDYSLNKKFIDRISKSDIAEMFSDAYYILVYDFYAENGYDSEFPEELESFRREINLLELYDEFLLDYGRNERIKALADDLVSGIESDYDKAKVIERYFYNNDYIYDLDYKKKKGENTEDFLFETKTGVCYEYATAMIMLARAAGIPARYCEGYNMTEKVERSAYGANYHVTAKDAHGFPELYIKGYGWVSFEPTVTDAVEKGNSKSATDMLTRAGLIILAVSVLLLLFSLVYPILSHKLFILISRKRMPNDTVRAVMHRICKVYGIESSNTAQEVRSIVYRTSGADIAASALLFDRGVYGEESLSENEKEKALEEYINAYDAFREAKKKRRITTKKS